MSGIAPGFSLNRAFEKSVYLGTEVENLSAWLVKTRVDFSGSCVLPQGLTAHTKNLAGLVHRVASILLYGDFPVQHSPLSLQTFLIAAVVMG